MKTRSIIGIVLAACLLPSCSGAYRIVKVEPASGFDWPYYMAVPAKAATPLVIVETNNSGQPTDDQSVQEKDALETLKANLRRYRSLGALMLSPAFPRPASQSMVLTHSLDRDTLLPPPAGEGRATGEPSIYRLDLQLLAMAEDARSRAGIQVREPFMVMVGFSASGQFANRFAFLHPRRVAAVAAGGLGTIMLPESELGGSTLNYPMGTADMEALSGAAFDMEAWLDIPQLYFMGGLDENDPMAYGDGHSDEDRAIAYSLLAPKGRLTDRFMRTAELYYAHQARASFIVYAMAAHSLSPAAEKKMQSFVKSLVEEAASKDASADEPPEQAPSVGETAARP
jgi:pimeloyl-ACP methyl ester carboxylesterase